MEKNDQVSWVILDENKSSRLVVKMPKNIALDFSVMLYKMCNDPDNDSVVWNIELGGFKDQYEIKKLKESL